MFSLRHLSSGLESPRDGEGVGSKAGHADSGGQQDSQQHGKAQVFQPPFRQAQNFTHQTLWKRHTIVTSHS